MKKTRDEEDTRRRGHKMKRTQDEEDASKDEEDKSKEPRAHQQTSGDRDVLPPLSRPRQTPSGRRAKHLVELVPLDEFHLFVKSFYIGVYFYLFCIGCAKISIPSFYCRLTAGIDRYKWFSVAAIWFIGLWILA